MKNIDYKQLKLKKYNVGKRQDIFSGYQQGEQVDTSSFSSTPAQQFGDYAKGIRSQIAPIAISQGTQLLGNLAGTISQIPGLSSGAVNVLGKTSSLLGGGASNITNSITNAAGASGSTTGSAASSILGVGSAGLGVLGLVNSGLGLANAISAFNDPIVTSSDALNSMGRSTQSKYGVNYTTYTGLDKKGIRESVNAANSRDKTNLAMQGANTGMAAGALTASLVGGGPVFPIVLGLAGLFSGLFGGAEAAWQREMKANRMIKNVMQATSNYNRNAEAEAGSQGLRNQFYNQHMFEADERKDVHTKFGKPGAIKMVHTSNGIEPGIELGVAGGKESIVNFKENTASVIKEGKKRVDNISVGIPLSEARGDQYDNALYTADTGKEDWDNNVFIAGNVTNPYTGNTIAEDAEPYAKNVEKINKQNPMTSLGKKTKEINLRNQMNELQHLSDIQSLVHLTDSYFANCGKTPKFDPGKDDENTKGSKFKANVKKILGSLKNSNVGDYMMVILPHLIQYGMLKSDNTDYTPRSFNPFVPSNYELYVNNMLGRKLNPAQAIKNQEKAGLQTRYALMNQKGLTAGQIAKSIIASNLAIASAKNRVIDDYTQKNITLANEANRLGMYASMSDAARQQQGGQYWWDNLARSGSNVNSIHRADKAAEIAQVGKLFSDVFDMNKYLQSVKWNNKQISLFDQDGSQPYGVGGSDMTRAGGSAGIVPTNQNAAASYDPYAAFDGSRSEYLKFFMNEFNKSGLGMYDSAKFSYLYN